MKKLNIILLTAISAVSLQACQSNKPASSIDSASTTPVKTDTATMPATDTNKTKMATTVDTADIKFADKAAIGGMAEVALAKLALEKTYNEKIKNFANMMITDHGKANDELAAIAKAKNISLPAAVDAEHQQKMDALTKMATADFDKAYVNAMVDGHKSTLTLMRNEAANGKDADLKKFADKTSAIVQMHTEMIMRIKAGK